MSMASPQSAADYQAFLRNVTGFESVAWFVNPGAGRVEFSAAGIPICPAQRAKLRMLGTSLLRIEARLYASDAEINQ